MEASDSEAFIDIMESLRAMKTFSRGRQQVLLHPIHQGETVQKEQMSAIDELKRLYHWAVTRRNYRIRKGALDEYLRHKTELYLTVKRDTKSIPPFSSSTVSPTHSNGFSYAHNNASPQSSKLTVVGYTSWSNASSVCLVSEYMILMSQTIGIKVPLFPFPFPVTRLGGVGELCVNQSAPVWFKIQVADPPLSAQDLDLRPRENAFTRAARIMLHLRSSSDRCSM